jgi:ribosomal protein S18 acetylase RimI-like enzyme
VEGARPADSDDLDRVAELADQAATSLAALRGGSVWVRREARPEPRRPAFEAALADPEKLVVVGTIDGTVVGYGAVQAEQLHDGQALAVVTDVYVEPDARGVGVGEAVMGLLLRWAEERGCVGVDSVALPGDRATKNFFESNGLVARAITVHKQLR